MSRFLSSVAVMFLVGPAACAAVVPTGTSGGGSALFTQGSTTFSLPELLTSAVDASDYSTQLDRLGQMSVGAYADIFLADLDDQTVTFGSRRVTINHAAIEVQRAGLRQAAARFPTMADYWRSGGIATADLNVSQMVVELANLGIWLPRDHGAELELNPLNGKAAVNVVDFCKLAVSTVRCLQDQAFKAELYSKPETWDVITENPSKTDAALFIAGVVTKKNPVIQSKLKIARALVANSESIAASLRQQQAEDDQ